MVLAPVEGIEAGQNFTVEWDYAASEGTTGDLFSFDIDLRSYSNETSGNNSSFGCGSHYISLCGSTRSCIDSDGRYDLQLPTEVEPGEYVMRVGLAANASIFGCSESFGVLPDAGGGHVEDGPFLQASTPNDLALGDAFTARWVYNDGTGGSAGTFEINLQSCEDTACDAGR